MVTGRNGDNERVRTVQRALLDALDRGPHCVCLHRICIGGGAIKKTPVSTARGMVRNLGWHDSPAKTPARRNLPTFNTVLIPDFLRVRIGRDRHVFQQADDSGFFGPGFTLPSARF